MRKNLSKNTVFLLSILGISLVSSIFLGNQLAILLFIILFFCYLTITKKHYLKVFKGLKAYRAENFKTSLECYRDAAMSPWCNGSIIINYLICELKYGKASLAKEYINENLKTKNIKEKEFLNLEITKSIVDWKTGSKENAINTLKELINDNKNTYIYETLTSLLLSSGKFDEAQKYITEAINFNSDNDILQSNYAEICYKLGNFTESKKIFDSLIEKKIKFIEPYYYSALIENKNGEYEKALELLRTAECLNESLISLISHKDIEQALNSVMIKSLNAAH